MIYFIKSESGHVKIGYSDNNVEGRLINLQCACPFKLTLLKTIRGGSKQEKLIHKEFKEFKFRGEWFLLSDKILNFMDNPYRIDELPPVITVKPKKPKSTVRISPSKIWTTLDRNELKWKDLATLMNLSVQYIYHCMRKGKIQKRYVPLLAEALNIEIKNFVLKKDIGQFS